LTNIGGTIGLGSARLSVRYQKPSLVTSVETGQVGVRQELLQRARVHDTARDLVAAERGGLLEEQDRELDTPLLDELGEPDRACEAGRAAAHDQDVHLHRLALDVGEVVRDERKLDASGGRARVGVCGADGGGGHVGRLSAASAMVKQVQLGPCHLAFGCHEIDQIEPAVAGR
jgi:hypothetical protein